MHLRRHPRKGEGAVGHGLRKCTGQRLRHVEHLPRRRGAGYRRALRPRGGIVGRRQACNGKVTWAGVSAVARKDAHGRLRGRPVAPAVYDHVCCARQIRNDRRPSLVDNANSPVQVLHELQTPQHPHGGVGVPALEFDPGLLTFALLSPRRGKGHHGVARPFPEGPSLRHVSDLVPAAVLGVEEPQPERRSVLGWPGAVDMAGGSAPAADQAESGAQVSVPPVLPHAIGHRVSQAPLADRTSAMAVNLRRSGTSGAHSKMPARREMHRTDVVRGFKPLAVPAQEEVEAVRVAEMGVLTGHQGKPLLRRDTADVHRASASTLGRGAELHAGDGGAMAKLHFVHSPERANLFVKRRQERLQAHAIWSAAVRAACVPHILGAGVHALPPHRWVDLLGNLGEVVSEQGVRCPPQPHDVLGDARAGKRGFAPSKGGVSGAGRTPLGKRAEGRGVAGRLISGTKETLHAQQKHHIANGLR
eukprot:scaffold1975_cov241-Pinguiococcus_pyrenoidosus.AAC.8